MIRIDNMQENPLPNDVCPRCEGHTDYPQQICRACDEGEMEEDRRKHGGLSKQTREIILEALNEAFLNALGRSEYLSRNPERLDLGTKSRLWCDADARVDDVENAISEFKDLISVQ